MSLARHVCCYSMNGARASAFPDCGIVPGNFAVAVAWAGDEGWGNRGRAVARMMRFAARALERLGENFRHIASRQTLCRDEGMVTHFRPAFAISSSRSSLRISWSRMPSKWAVLASACRCLNTVSSFRRASSSSIGSPSQAAPTVGRRVGADDFLEHFRLLRRQLTATDGRPLCPSVS